jgi:hypothetical protein
MTAQGIEAGTGETVGLDGEAAKARPPSGDAPLCTGHLNDIEL